MSICPRTGVTQPECSCPDCLTALIRRHQPALLEAEAIGVIGMGRGASAPAHADIAASRPRAA